VDEKTRTYIEKRVERELNDIDDLKLAGLMKPQIGRKPLLQDVLEDETLSIVGYLVGSLAFVDRPVISSVSDFLRENKYHRAAKQGGLNDKNIRELILTGCFGEPRAIMQEYLGLVGKEDMPVLDWDRERAFRLFQIRDIDTDAIEHRYGRRLTSFKDYLNPMSSGSEMMIAGQLVEPVHKLPTKGTRGAMGFMDLYPNGCDEQLENPRFQVVVWPRSWHLFKSLSPEPSIGDVLIVHGVRDYNEKRDHPQLAVPADGEIQVWKQIA